ncbi:hypothetical protein COR50_18750 [Chitinophaga caeni]|uniref:Uncharacterized protein n=1 Tax=Chitinophaga caeni TaxID=2029983 RepID=A0A291QYW7_9BACT|nr:hypothetical protein [Chitinophaga caeni]ATL49044.1 hypothetical protein COR50_18750 [Chitinophaga caeni]
MKLFLLYCFVLLNWFPTHLEEKWQQQLAESLKTLDQSGELKTWEQETLKLQKLADANPKEWLLQYYAAWSNIQMAFQAPSTEASKFCQTAEGYVENALQLQPSNTETLVLKAYYLSAKIKVDPATAVVNGPSSQKWAEKAIEADTNNPRAYLVKALVVYHTPGIFGGGKKKALEIFNTAQAKFKTFVPSSDIAPRWGQKILDVSMKEYQ